MTFPHCFPSLIDDPELKALLIAGAGLSFGYLPAVDGLEGHLDVIAKGLGLEPSGNFYGTSELVLDKLIGDGKTDAEARLWLAEKLGLLDDRCWFGEVGLPLSGNTPRHRAIARFAVENRLMAIVSLNWDALLETALDSVGLADGARSPRPWGTTAYASVVDDTHIVKLKAHVFPVYKPHGCVRDLESVRKQAETTGATPPVVFKLTSTELDTQPPEQKTLVDTNVHAVIAQCPLIAVGWKASEKYLRDRVINTARAVERAEPDAFTLTSRSWYPRSAGDDSYHEQIASAYNKTKDDAFVSVGHPGEPSLDCVFQWLQGRYALNKLIAATPDPNKTALQAILNSMSTPDCDSVVLSWVDRWLPAWVRMCWRAGVMQGLDPLTGRQIDPWDMPITPRDISVPLGGIGIPRSELRAAANLLVTLNSDLSRFDFEKFPGGMWHEETLTLYIPLPGWQSGSDSADLAGLKPLLEDLRGLGFVRNISLLWLHPESLPIDPEYGMELAAQVSGNIPLMKFATVDSLPWLDLEGLKGDIHASVA